MRRILSLVVVLVLAATVASAQSLGSAGSFGALGATTVTNVPTGTTVVTGNLGVSPGTAITGFEPEPINTIEGPGTVTAGTGLVTGTIYAGSLVAAQAHAAAFVAGEELKLMECLPANNLTGQDLGGLVLPPATYCFDSSAQLTGNLTLTGTGPWVFKIKSTLTTATASAVLVPNVSTCSGANVFWQVGSSATLGTGTQFVGNIVAETSITANANASVSGSLLAVNAAVTLDNNLITACGAVTPPPPPPDDDCDCKCDHEHHKHHHHKGDHGNDHHHGDDDGHHGHKDDCDLDHHSDRDGHGNGGHHGNNDSRDNPGKGGKGKK